jgi:hypothetical protein
MDCLINLIALCLFDPSNLTIRADFGLEIAGGFHYTVNDTDVGTGKLVAVRLEMPVRVNKKLEFTYGVEHISLLDANDRGQERVYLGITWKPFQ